MNATYALAQRTGFCRVNRRRPCLICGKSDWCSYTRDERISVCMRESKGARKINRRGGAIYVHAGAERVDPAPILPRAEPLPDLAPIEVRDLVYSELIRLSPSVRYGSMLVRGEYGLLARGFKRDQVRNYGALPASREERDRLARRLLEDMRERFQTQHPLRGVPGFWEDDEGIHLWKQADYYAPRLIIPVRDSDGRIQACQMRCVGRAANMLRYCWLSSAGMPHGAGSGSPIHLNFRPRDASPDSVIMIVEGALKADAFAALRPGARVVATAGVAANHQALIEVTKGLRVVIAFDQDYHWNRQVCLQLATLIAMRLRGEGTLATTWVAAWDGRAKGVDDAALHNLPIRPLGVGRWLAGLGPGLRRDVADLWYPLPRPEQPLWPRQENPTKGRKMLNSLS